MGKKKAKEEEVEVEKAEVKEEESQEPEPSAELEALEEIREAREEVRRKEADYLDQKERAKEAKQSWEAAVSDLTCTIDRLTKPMPLFDSLKKQEAAKKESPEPPTELHPDAVRTIRVKLLTRIAVGNDVFGEPGEAWAFVDRDDAAYLANKDEDGNWHDAFMESHEYEEVSQEEADDSWRFAPIESLTMLGGSLTGKLREANIGTIGALEDLRAEISQGKAKWPKGIGEAKITAIEEAVVEWLSTRRQAG